MSINKLSGGLYKLARFLRDINAASKSVSKGSPAPLGNRILNKIIGRNVVSKLFKK